MKTYKEISSLLSAIENCKKSNNQEWQYRHEEKLREIIKNFSGGGLDIELNNKSEPEKIILDICYHCMSDVGYYDGYYYFTAVITPSLQFNYNLDFKNFSLDKYHYKKYWYMLEDYIAENLNYQLDKELN